MGEDCRDRSRAAFRLAENLGKCRREDEKGKEGQERQKREVSSVDEPIIVYADRDPLDHFPPLRAPRLVTTPLTQVPLSRAKACWPSRRKGGEAVLRAEASLTGRGLKVPWWISAARTLSLRALC